MLNCLSLREIYYTFGNFLRISLLIRSMIRVSYNRVTNKTKVDVRYISISLGAC